MILTVYNRFTHFQNCVTSLQENEGAEKTTLYISSDGPRSIEDRASIERVRDFIRDISGFKEVIVAAPLTNTKGKIKDEVIRRVRGRHSAYIFAEDDLQFASNFLKFVNRGLQEFASNPRILAVCGYLYPNFPISTGTQLYLKCFTAWGYGTWSDRGDFSSRQREIASQIFADRSHFQTASRLLPHTIRLSREIMKEKLLADDVTACNRLVLEDQYCVFPSATLVRNTGFDGSGEHCALDLTYLLQELSPSCPTIDPEKTIEFDEKGQEFLFHFFGGRIVTMLNFFLLLEYSSRWRALGAPLKLFNELIWALASRMNRIFLAVRNSRYNNELR